MPPAYISLSPHFENRLVSQSGVSYHVQRYRNIRRT